MNNYWAIACAALLYLGNMYIYPFIHLMVLHADWNELPWNILHMLINISVFFLLGYGTVGILTGCGMGIAMALFILIGRLKYEGFSLK